MPFLLDNDGRRKFCVLADTTMGVTPRPGSSSVPLLAPVARYRRAEGWGSGAPLPERTPDDHPAPSLALSSFAFSR